MFASVSFMRPSRRSVFDFRNIFRDTDSETQSTAAVPEGEYILFLPSPSLENVQASSNFPATLLSRMILLLRRTIIDS